MRGPGGRRSGQAIQQPVNPHLLILHSCALVKALSSISAGISHERVEGACPYLNVEAPLEGTRDPEGQPSLRVLHIAQQEQVKEEPANGLHQLLVPLPLTVHHRILCVYVCACVWVYVCACVYVCVCAYACVCAYEDTALQYKKG